MVEYKSEILKTMAKWVSMKADDSDLAALDSLINQRAG